MRGTCVWCGAPVTSGGATKRYCSEKCHKEARNFRKQELRTLAAGRSHTGAENAREIARINALARAAGMSYGRFLAHEKYIQAMKERGLPYASR